MSPGRTPIEFVDGDPFLLLNDDTATHIAIPIDNLGQDGHEPLVYSYAGRIHVPSGINATHVAIPIDQYHRIFGEPT